MQLSVLCSSKRRAGRTQWSRSLLSTISWLLGVALTAVMGLIHLRLWLDGYRQIPVIGPLFLLNVVFSGALAAALLAAPARLRSAAATITALFMAGTLAGLIISLTVGLPGMQEILQAPLVVPTLIVEPVGVLVLVTTALLDRGRRSQ